MRFEVNNKTERALNAAVMTASMNMEIAGCIIAPMENCYVFEDEQNVKSEAEMFRELNSGRGYTFTDEECITGAMLMTIASEENGTLYGGLPLPLEIIALLLKQSRIFKEGAFSDNAYLKHMKFEECTYGKYTLTYETAHKYEPQQYALPVHSKEGYLIPRTGVFDHDFRFPCIVSGENAPWAVSHMDINVAEKDLNRAKGKVLVLGCGIGYYAYMASLKNNVSQITIVEHDQDLVNMFQEQILPQFECKDKITVICADETGYLKSIEDGMYNTVYCALWQDNTAVIPYLEVKKICSSFKKTKLVCHLEQAIQETIHFYMITLMMRNRNDQTEETSIEDETAKYLENCFKDTVITTAKQTEDYLDPVNVVRIICAE